ncbi:MAG TPA: M48 family metallopeptidase [Halomicronema sp.]
MTFFEYQDRAHQNTQKLIGLFILSLLAIILSLYGATLLALSISSNGKTTLVLWDAHLFFLVAIPTILIICTGSGYKLFQLRQGGKTIALDLGGRRIYSDTKNPAEKQLLNVVQEMAIASGISTPAVYILDRENGINAFAAGFTPKDAVIGVTRGCLEHFNREELQGVIGHEFSHILNGDMRLNLRVVGVLHGILLIYITGRLLLEWSGDWHDRKKFDAALFFAFSVMAIGSIGLFCGRLIKSAISRQREFLADASAVQFTRNPSGIASALEKIKNHSYQSLLQSPYAESNSHLFFGSALSFDFLNNWYATHPPLEQRIRRLEAFRGKYSDSKSTLKTASSLKTANSPTTSTNSLFLGFANNSSEKPPLNQALLSKFSPEIQAGVSELNSAITIIYSLFLDRENSQLQEKQISWLQQTLNISENSIKITQEIIKINPNLRIPLLDLLTPSLHQISATSCQQLFNNIINLSKIKKQWTPADFAVYAVLWHRLQFCLNSKTEKTIKYTTLKEIWDDCLIIFAAVANAGQKTPETAHYAFRASLDRLPGNAQQTIPETMPIFKLNDLHNSLKRISFASPKLKQTILDSSAYTVLIDNKITIEEADLLRVIAINFDCPLPAFLESGRFS